ncbi:hypothetical protein ACGC1H_001125 [Rhizoctonia solani]|uniref:Uncharacterized protein n=1 Tax=Rhizoctonia solani TaxID=456999 RepID=A0A8H3CHB3_9AGAM|nr:unnamed protein product [Rhizoctonia solani]
MSGSSSSTGPSSTFWIIDTTSVSDTFATTATFTLWVPLNTPSTTPASASVSPEPSRSPARSNTPVLAGSVIGAVLGTSLVFTCLVLYYKRRVKRAVVQPRTKLCDTPSGSEHALFDLAAEPAPHPDNIEPWVAPAVVRRSNKARDEARRHQDASAPRAEAAPRVEHLTASAGSNVQIENSAGSPEQRTRSNLQVQAVETRRMSAIPGSTSHGHGPIPGSSQPRLHLHQPEALSTGTKSTAVPRRRALREPSPPRLEEDAGVSLMRAGDDALPPSYGDLVHDHSA